MPSAWCHAFIMAFKAVFFDAAGTLIRPAKPIGESYALLAGKYGKQVPATEVRERFRSCFSSAHRSPSREPRLRISRIWSADGGRSW